MHIFSLYQNCIKYICHLSQVSWYVPYRVGSLSTRTPLRIFHHSKICIIGYCVASSHRVRSYPTAKASLTVMVYVWQSMSAGVKIRLAPNNTTRTQSATCRTTGRDENIAAIRSTRSPPQLTYPSEIQHTLVSKSDGCFIPEPLAWL